MTAALAILAVVLLACILWLLITATVRLDDVTDEVATQQQRLDDLERRWPA